MKQFELLVIEIYIDSIEIRSTNSGVLSWALSSIQTTEPSCKVEKAGSGHDLWGMRIKDFKNRNATSLVWSIMKALCNKGWEPFASGWFDIAPSAMAIERYSFRIQNESDA